MITQIDNFLIHTHKACWFLCTLLSLPKNLTDINYPCSLDDLAEILHQIFLLCFPLWSDSRTTFVHGHRTPRLTKPFAQQRWVMPTYVNSDRMPEDSRRMAGEHTDSHCRVFFNNNFPVWVMLTIIRQTECQTIVRKAVKHFCYYPLHKSVIYHHRKSTLKKNLETVTFCSNYNPASLTACGLTSSMSEVMLGNLFPSTEQVSGVGSRHC